MHNKSLQQSPGVSSIAGCFSVFTPIIVLSSLRRFVECVVQGTEERTAFLDLIKSITEEIIKIDREVVGQDFERAEI
jgi:hypothetical protein